MGSLLIKDLESNRGSTESYIMKDGSLMELGSSFALERLRSLAWCLGESLCNILQQEPSNWSITGLSGGVQSLSAVVKTSLNCFEVDNVDSKQKAGRSSRRQKSVDDD
jgi:hypothetical protein